MFHPYGPIEVSGQPSKRPTFKPGSGSIVEDLLSMHKALGSMPSAQIKKEFYFWNLLAGCL